MITSSRSVIHTFTVVPVDRRRLVRAPAHLDPCSRFFDDEFQFSPFTEFNFNMIFEWTNSYCIVSYDEVVTSSFDRVKIVPSLCDILYLRNGNMRMILINANILDILIEKRRKDLSKFIFPTQLISKMFLRFVFTKKVERWFLFYTNLKKKNEIHTKGIIIRFKFFFVREIILNESENSRSIRVEPESSYFLAALARVNNTRADKPLTSRADCIEIHARVSWMHTRVTARRSGSDRLERSNTRNLFYPFYSTNDDNS